MLTNGWMVKPSYKEAPKNQRVPNEKSEGAVSSYLMDPSLMRWHLRAPSEAYATGKPPWHVKKKDEARRRKAAT